MLAVRATGEDNGGVAVYQVAWEVAVVQGIEQAPAWVRDLLPSPEEQAASHAEAQAALDAIRRGDRSGVVTVEQHLAELEALDAAEDPGAEAV
jgi:hypothetical protein